MSDFDKEAERERLREKYERDQEKREATEQMSELLLKGATMTNAHCEDCGDPIFRYDGQEFCPTCQEVVSEADEASPEANSETAGDAGTPADTRVADESGTPGDTGAAEGHGEGATGTADGATAGDEGGADATQSAGGGSAGGSTSSGPARQPSGSLDQRPTGHRSAGQGTGPASPASGAPESASPASEAPESASPVSGGPESQASGSGDPLGQARASLTRTLLAQARRAEGCENPRRAEAHLAAAREAAQALAALS